MPIDVPDRIARMETTQLWMRVLELEGKLQACQQANMDVLRDSDQAFERVKELDKYAGVLIESNRMLAEERDSYASRLDTIRGICEAAHSMADANNAVEKIARIVERRALKSDGHEFCATCPDCGGQPHRGACKLPVFE